MFGDNTIVFIGDEGKQGGRYALTEWKWLFLAQDNRIGAGENRGDGEGLPMVGIEGGGGKVE